MSKIIISIENHNCIFKKPKENDAEIIFYNTDYFKRIGFPDAEVIIGTTSPDGTMKGGYYKNPETLTYPFRHLVYLVQGTGKPNVNPPTNPILPLPKVQFTNPMPNFFERLGNYGKEATNMIATGIENAGTYFNKKSTPEPPVSEPQSEPEQSNSLLQTQEEPVSETPISEPEQPSSLLQTQGESVPETPVSDTQPQSEPEKPNSLLQTQGEPVSETPLTETQSEPEKSTEPIQYYKVVIPINKPTSKIPLGKYEKEELLLNYMILENKVEKSLGKSKSGKLYKVGNRYIRMCEEVKEWTSLKTPPSTLIGTKMYKMNKVTNK